MNIMELGALGEFVGSVGVIATLIYLAIQVRQNTRVARASSQHSVSEAFSRLNLMLSEQPDLAEVVSLGNTDISNLGGVDEKFRIGYENYNLAFMRAYEEAYSDHRRGLLDDEYWQTRERTLRAYALLPGVREWWNGTGIGGPFREPRNTAFQPGFVALVDSLTAE